MWRFEKLFARQGFTRIAGVDEAGRGPLAGPVVAAAVILPLGIRLKGLTDSKALSEGARVHWDAVIREKALAIGVGLQDEEAIERCNILGATKLAMIDALEQVEPDLALIDGNQRLDWPHPQETIVGGDALSMSIAAASVIAKVYRDRLMLELDEAFPQYGFARHKGYPTKEHREAIRRFGPSPHHRMGFRLLDDSTGK